MAEITAQAVNEFRKRTGLGLMECKALLKESDGDMKKAETLAKERGLKNAEKRAGRAAKAGRIEVEIASDGTAGAMLELNCETDFVARNDEFRQMARDLVTQVLAAGEAGLMEQKLAKQPSKTVREALIELNARTGENVSVARAVRFKGGGRVDAYVHHNWKEGALVQMNGPADATTVKDLAMQVVASRPMYVRREEFPAEVVAEQKRIFLTQAADKPENVREKIAIGKLDAWYKESTLLEQDLIKDPSKKVRDLIPGGVTVTRFARFVVGDASESESEVGGG
jgi:elongation factor Ts